MDDPTEATGSRTSLLPPASPSARRAGTGEASVETLLPPPAGRTSFRQRFLRVGAVDVEPASTAVDIAAGGNGSPHGPSGEPVTRPMDPDLAHLAGLLSDLVEDLRERGEAALEIGEGLPSFQVTLRAYCRGYLDGRQGAREA